MKTLVQTAMFALLLAGPISEKRKDMSAQISLSFELISLLNWLLRHEKTLLNAMLKQALEHGFAEELQKVDATSMAAAESEELYSTVLDFLEYLEQSLIKSLESIHVDNKTKDAIMPTLQKLETDSLDHKTLWLSMQQTKARILKAKQLTTQQPKAAKPEASSEAKSSHTEHANKILFEQLLKNWKPNNKDVMN